MLDDLEQKEIICGSFFIYLLKRILIKHKYDVIKLIIRRILTSKF